MQIATYIIAITIATGLLFGVTRMTGSLERRLEQLFEELRNQHAEREHLKAIEIITLFRQLAYLDRRQSRVEWMERFLGTGYVAGYVSGAGGLLLLQLCATFGWSESTAQIATTVVSFLALASIIANLFVILGVWQACRRGMKEASIAH